MYNEKEIEDKILELRSGLKTDRLDMSFGEIINLYDEGDLIITPEYQRAYRWSDEQKTRFIESVLLGIPIPPIFVAEDDNGKWELVDGLQRISTILSFFGLLKNDYQRKNFFKLSQTELTENYLQDVDINHLSTKLKITIKRAVCRVEILRWDSGFDMRYELFNRLNTGASPLTEQEIRNCVFIGKFNSLLHRLAENEKFQNLVKPTKKQLEQMFLEEMVLRYFAVKLNYKDLYITKDIKEYLTSFMKDVNDNKIAFDYQKEEEDFYKIINFFSKNNIYKPFKGKNNAFSPSIYETVMYSTLKYINKYENNINKYKEYRHRLINDNEFIKYAGYETSQKERLKKKINRALELLDD